MLKPYSNLTLSLYTIVAAKLSCDTSSRSFGVVSTSSPSSPNLDTMTTKALNCI